MLTLSSPEYLLQSENIIDLINSYQDMQQQLKNLYQSLCITDQHLPIWFDPPKSFVETNKNLREQAYNFICQIEYLDKQDPREILLGPGIIASNTQTLNAIDKLNTAKLNFKQAMLNIKNTNFNLQDTQLQATFEKLLPSREPGTSKILKRNGLSRLHLKQCYRILPILQHKPIKISWTWANTKSIKKISIAQAETALKKLKTDLGIKQQLEKLKNLKNNENLAIVQELAPHLRVNIVLPTCSADESTTERKMIKGAVPIFYPYDPSQPELPQLVQPKAKNSKAKRERRSDIRLEDEAYLPAIRAHRYAD